jgi:hypothetical protein
VTPHLLGWAPPSGDGLDQIYALLYFCLLMGTGDLSEDYIEGLFEHGMKGLRKK